MKKNTVLFYIFCAVVMLVGMGSCQKLNRNNPLDPGATGYISYKTNRVDILTLNFEASIPTVWAQTLTGNLGGTVYAGAGWDLNHCYAINDFTASSNNDYGRLANTNLSLSGHFYIEFYQKLSDFVSWESGLRFFNNTNSIYLSVGMFATNLGHFYYNDGTFHQGGNYNMSDWYLITMDINMDTGKFSASYKNITSGISTIYPIADNANLPVGFPNPVTKIDFRSRLLKSGTAPTMYFDDLVIYKKVVTEVK